MNVRPRLWPVILLGVACMTCAADPAPAAPFTVAAKIPLPGVKGRIDHLAYDTHGQRLFVAELGNDSVSIVDVKDRRVLRRIADLPEPQGVGFFPGKQRLYVATGRDGMVRAFRTTDYTQVAARHVGDDADNLRVDVDAAKVYVGHGDGALATLDADSLGLLGTVRLDGHPESFQLSPADARVFVNVPHANQVVVVDRARSTQIASWPVSDARANYPMTLDRADARLLTVFRRPPRIAAYPLGDDGPPRLASTCADADDVYVDESRQRVYVVCGEGEVAVHDATTLGRLADMPTSPGARTGFYSPEADRLFVAAPAQPGNDAAIWILKPSP